MQNLNRPDRPLDRYELRLDAAASAEERASVAEAARDAMIDREHRRSGTGPALRLDAKSEPDPKAARERKIAANNAAWQR